MRNSVRLVSYGACVALLSAASPANAEIIQASSGQCFFVTRDANGTITSSRAVTCPNNITIESDDDSGLTIKTRLPEKINGKWVIYPMVVDLPQKDSGAKERRILADMSKMAAVLNIVSNQGGNTGGTGGASAGGGTGTPGASHLGMYVSPNSTGWYSAMVGGGGGVIRSDGIGVFDTAGLLPIGSTTGAARDTVGGGSAGLTYDVNGPGAPHQLSFGAAFDYARHDANIGTTPALAAVGLVGSARVTEDVYTLRGEAAYSFGQTYLIAAGRWSFRSGSQSLGFDGSSGSFSGDGFAGDVTAGHLFALYSTVTTPPPSSRGLPTKAPAKSAEGMFVALALSGHIGYLNDTDDGFVDTTGFIYGKSHLRFGAAGAQAKLIAAIADNRTVWMPYVAVAGDQRFSYTNTLDIPAQAGLPVGDTFSRTPALTFWSTKAGVDVASANGLIVGVSGAYSASSDMHGIGGNAYARIPFAMLQ